MKTLMELLELVSSIPNYLIENLPAVLVFILVALVLLWFTKRNSKETENNEHKGD